MDSLKKRYSFKVLANMIGTVISFFTQLMIPRGLGPAAYGNFSFLTNFFSEVVSFFDMGTSQAFFTKLSQRANEYTLTVFYSYFMTAVCLLTFVLPVIPMMFGVKNILWPGQGTMYIWLAVLLGCANWVVMIFNQMMDAHGLTVGSEMARIAQRLAGLVIIASLFFLGNLNLTSFFLYNILVAIFLIWLNVVIMRSSHVVTPALGRLKRQESRKYIKEFFTYTHPLFVYSIAGMIAAIFDRWILQLCGGSAQQGFYGLSYQIGAICFVFAGAMTPLIMREFSISYHKMDIGGMTKLFRRHIPLLYSITAFMACFIAANAGRVTLIVGGGKFISASLAVAIMALHPIHATYGQLSSSVFMATGKTALYRNIGLVFMALGLPMTYFLIAPHASFGMNLGAVGLAIKVVLLQFLWVNVMLYFNARLLNLNFIRYIAHQIFSVMFFLAAAFFSNFVSGRVLGMTRNPVILFCASGALYMALAAASVHAMPQICGLHRHDIKAFTAKIRAYIG